jgi:hypothetical protein
MSNEPKEFNRQARIKLVDSDNNLIRTINQGEAKFLLRYWSCKLLMVKPATVQFPFESRDWRNGMASHKPKGFNNSKFAGLQSRQSTLYGNIFIQSPDGQEMFTCDNHKALWYLNRDIVDVVSENPPTLRLAFIPNGKGHIGDKFYLAPKSNICVVCGAEKRLNRHHVMPRVFRRHLPHPLKTHNYHDIVLTCLKCHSTYETHADNLKKAICKEYGCDIKPDPSFTENGPFVRAAHALLKHGHEMPETRKEVLSQMIKTFLNKEEVTQEDLKTLSNATFRWKKSHNHYGQVVMEQVTSPEDVQKFVERWRQHFLTTMKPKHMPEHWDVSRPVVRQ